MKQLQIEPLLHPSSSDVAETLRQLFEADKRGDQSYWGNRSTIIEAYKKNEYWVVAACDNYTIMKDFPVIGFLIGRPATGYISILQILENGERERLGNQGCQGI